ncbi:MAG: carboxypeptidase-like regulatory domain-containing protein [Terriglobales bacterium]
MQGTVTDPSGALVGGAKVTINNKSTGRLITVTTTSAGAYTSGALTPGDYTIRIEAPGFKTTEIPVTVQVGVTASGNARLQVGQASQVVEVQGSAIEVNTEQATIQGVLTTQQIENLPINGRNFLDLAQLEPGVQIQDGGNFDPTKNGFSSISFGGRFGRTARIEVDGLDISDETVGTTTQNVPEGAIQEFQIQQSSLDLSTELTSSGSVNVTTKSGTNGYHGEGYYNFRDHSLDANLPGGSTNYFQRNQYGGNFGGPIIKDRVFFFLDAERTKQDLLDPVIPSGDFSALTGNFDSPFREVEGLAKLDWQISNNYKLFYRFSYDQNHSVLAIIPNSFQPFGNVNHTPVQAVGLDFITGGFTHSIRFGYTKFRNGIVDAVAGSPIYNPLPGIELAIGGDPDCLTAGLDDFCSGPSFLAPQKTYQSDRQFKYDGSKAVGKHILRYGGGLNHIFGGGFASFLALGPAVSANVGDCVPSPTLPFPNGCNNPLNYPANTVQLGNGQGYDSEIPAFGFPAGGSGPDNRLSFYFGDAWKIRPGLTLTYGLRYVRDTGRSDADLAGIPGLSQNFDNQYYSNLGARVNQPNKNFAPQIGIAWDPRHNGKTVIRGGIGLFYENSIWNNIEFDRPARLASGLFLANPTVCNGGSGGVFTLPNQATQNWNGICGQPIGSVASQILANQQQYQAATISAGPASNPSYITNTLADGLDVTGTDLLYPKYVSPRSVQMNFGIQREIRKGMVVSADYLRNIETHTLLAIDTNHVGDARFFNKAAAQNAIAVTTAQFNCAGGYSAAAINCAIAAGATISDFAAPKFDANMNPLSGGLDSGYSSLGGFPADFTCGPSGLICLTPATGAAFPGINPNVGANQMLFPSGRAVYNGLQLSFKQDVQTPTRYIRNLNMQVSYSLSRYVAMATDNDFISIATDFRNPLHYLGPNGLDRKHQLSFGGSMDLPYKFRLGVIGHFYSPLPVTPTLYPSGNPGGIFVTDLTGDGTGDGSFGSNGGFGDVLPGTGIGSFGRSVNASNINTYIQNYNNSIAAGVPTPAGQTLIQNGLFTLAQLVALGGVQQPVPLAPKNSPNMGWLHAMDLSLNWIYKFRENIELQPGISFYNVMNFSNVDGPANPLSGVLSGAVGSINGAPNNGTINEQQPSNRLGLGSGVFALGSPRALEFTLKLSF